MVKPKVVGGASSAGGGTVVTPPQPKTPVLTRVQEQFRHKPAGQWPPPPKLDPASVEEFVRTHQGSHSRQWITKSLRDAGLTERGAAKKMVDMILDAPVASPANEAALLRVSSKLTNPPPALKEAAQTVLSKPGASVTGLADDLASKYGMTREKAVEFVETIRRLAEAS